jgi:hypothetical protein
MTPPAARTAARDFHVALTRFSLPSGINALGAARDEARGSIIAIGKETE